MGLWSRLSGSDQVGRIGRLLGRDASRLVDATADTAAAALRRQPDPYQPDRWTDARGRFEGAAAHYGTTPDGIRRTLRATYGQFWVACAYLACLPLSALWLGSLPLWTLGTGFLAAVYALRAGVTNWTFRRRSADGVAAYLRSGDWAPRKDFA